MAVFRVERNKGYTVMSNHHLRNKELSLKAKGLLSQMLSLPEDWDYTLKGLSLINREKIDAIREAIKELERAGYIVRSRERDEKGRLRGADYVIFEQPQPPTPDLPTLENPTLDNPTQEKPTLEKPTLENPTQLNKDIQRTDLPKKEKIITDEQSTHSIPILSPNPSPCREAATPPERKGTEAAAQSAVDIYREIIKDNIDYHILKQDMKFDSDRLDEIVDLMLETVCTARKRVRIAGDDYPAELVKSKFMKLDGEHILNVKLTNKPISEIAEELLTPQQLEMYRVYLETSGNKPLIFGGGSPDMGASEDLSGVQLVNGTRPGNTAVVDLAKRQVGNVGGRPFWSWYGFNSRVEWCACFVSWCYNQAGKSEPRFAGCQSQGVPWFQSRGQWGARGYENIAPGDAIFFDWDGDGSADHVGLVIGTDGERVYTVEGNSGDACKIKSYPVNYSCIKGYGLMNWN